MGTPESETHARWWPSVRGFAPGSGEAYFAETHVLLLGLAGRFPDEDLVELRELVVREPVVVPDAIVRAALAVDVALTRQEVNAIVEVARGFKVPGGEPRYLGKLALVEAMTDGGHRFVARPDVARDYIDVIVPGCLAPKRGMLRVWRAWRADASGPRRVFLAEVAPGTKAWRLTAILQEEMAKFIKPGPEGDDTVVPTVEMFWRGQDLPPYQLAALAVGQLLWSTEQENQERS